MARPRSGLAGGFGGGYAPFQGAAAWLAGVPDAGPLAARGWWIGVISVRPERVTLTP